MTLPWLVMFLRVMFWTPKTRREWYLQAALIGCQLAILLYAYHSK